MLKFFAGKQTGEKLYVPDDIAIQGLKNVSCLAMIYDLSIVEAAEVLQNKMAREQIQFYKQYLLCNNPTQLLHIIPLFHVVPLPKDTVL